MQSRPLPDYDSSSSFGAIYLKLDLELNNAQCILANFRQCYNLISAK